MHQQTCDRLHKQSRPYKPCGGNCLKRADRSGQRQRSVSVRDTLLCVRGGFWGVSGQGSDLRGEKGSIEMFFRLPRLTPGYIRYLQTQAVRSELQREKPLASRFAMLLGLMGFGMSGYSSRQLTLHYKPSPHLLR
ncbi:hypothetical protein SRHO_G00148260 [Serrasalmus rhombeus]